MKYLLITLLLVVSLGCDTLDKVQPEENQQAIEEAKPKNNTDPSLPEQGSMNPGEITIKVKVMEVYNSNKDICGVSKQNVLLTNVLEIIEKGSSITYMPDKGDQLLVNFLLAPKDLDTDMVIEAKARESLCREASKTYFTVTSYKIIE